MLKPLVRIRLQTGAGSSNFVIDTQMYVLKERITLHFKCHIFTFAGLYN